MSHIPSGFGVILMGKRQRIRFPDARKMKEIRIFLNTANDTFSMQDVIHKIDPNLTLETHTVHANNTNTQTNLLAFIVQTNLIKHSLLCYYDNACRKHNNNNSNTSTHCEEKEGTREAEKKKREIILHQRQKYKYITLTIRIII